MNKGVVSYQCSCVGINFNDYKIEINALPLLGFAIKADGSLLEIDVELVDIFDESTANKLAYDSVCKLLDHICLMFLVKIGEPRQIRISLPQKFESEVRLAVHNMYQAQFIENVQPQVFPNPKSLDSLKMQVENYWGSHNVRMRLFRNSISQEDPVTRYLLLYNVLLFIHSDRQKELDKCIAKIDTNVEHKPSPKDNKPETIYTRLRNEIGHNRQGVKSQTTIKEITEQLSKFTDIVKQVVLNP